MFLNLCAGKDFGKNYLGESNIALFTREICTIRSKDRCYLEKTDFGKEIDIKERKFGKKLFFRDHIILGAEIKDSSSSAPRTSKHTNYVPRPEHRYF